MMVPVADIAACRRLAAPYLVIPPKPRDLMTFARTMRLSDGPCEGQLWDPETEPVQSLFVRAMMSKRWSIFCVVAPSQRGKTLMAILLPWMYAACETGRSFGYVMPNLDKLNQLWTGKIKPSIKGAGYGHFLPTKGPGSMEGRPSALAIRNPMTGRKSITYFMAAGKGASETSLSAVSPPEMGIDEADDFENVGQIELAMRRLESHGNSSRCYVSSTINERGDRQDHPILDLYNRADSTKWRIAHRCPHCGTFQVMTRSHLDIETGRVHCRSEGCGAVWSEEDRHDALNRCCVSADGAIMPIDDALKSDSGTICGLLTNGLDFHMAVPSRIAAGERAARDKLAMGDHSQARLNSHKVWCEPYTGDRLEDDDGKPIYPTRSRLAALSSASDLLLHVNSSLPDGDSLHFTDLPAWVEFQTLGVDVQRGGDRAPGRLVWAIYGHGGGRGAVTAWGSIIASPAGREPTAGELYQALDKLDGILNDWNPKAPIVRRGVDVGDRQDELIRWILPRGTRWLAVKGSANLKTDGTDLPGWIYHRTQESGGTPWWLHLVDSQGVIRVVHAELLAEPGKPGSIQLAHGLDRESALIKHLCSTAEYQPGKWSKGPKDRIHHPEWQERNDYLDSLKYARALAYAYVTELMRAEARVRAEQAARRAAMQAPPPPAQSGYERRTTYQRRNR